MTIWIEIHHDGDNDVVAETAEKMVERIEDIDWWDPELDPPYAEDEPPWVWVVDEKKAKEEAPDAPCDHYDDRCGIVESAPGIDYYLSAITCRQCIPKMEGWVQMVTGVTGAFHSDEDLRKDRENAS